MYKVNSTIAATNPQMVSQNKKKISTHTHTERKDDETNVLKY